MSFNRVIYLLEIVIDLHLNPTDLQERALRAFLYGQVLKLFHQGKWPSSKADKMLRLKQEVLIF